MHLSFFPDFFDKPEGIQFAEQETNETIELMLRQHWVTNIPWIFTSLIAFALPAILLSFDKSSGSNLIAKLPLELVLGGLIIWYMLVLAYVIERFLHWYFNIYIVTNLHVIDINFDSLLSREFLEAGLENVESASSKISGIFASLFNYGNVVIQTAAHTQDLTFTAVPFPDEVVDRINDLRAPLGGGGNP